MSNKTFDILRTIVEIVLPAISAAYFGLSEIWGLPVPDKICGTIAVLITFISAFLNVKRKQYNDELNGGDM
ncbi:MAG: hypothetical protein IIZ68_04455 [Clostridia bacterium]|jgi:hypothetical protein|nr:hypothetical protein [Clostridia bacterium]